MNKIVFNWVVLFVYLFLIFYLSSLPRIELLEKTPEFFLRDKILHVLEFGVLASLSYNAFKNHNILNEKIYFYIIMFATIYGAILEINQVFVPNRVFSFYDILANFLGSLTILFKKLF